MSSFTGYGDGGQKQGHQNDQQPRREEVLRCLHLDVDREFEMRYEMIGDWRSRCGYSKNLVMIDKQ